MRPPLMTTHSVSPVAGFTIALGCALGSTTSAPSTQGSHSCFEGVAMLRCGSSPTRSTCMSTLLAIVGHASPSPVNIMCMMLFMSAIVSISRACSAGIST